MPTIALPTKDRTLEPYATSEPIVNPRDLIVLSPGMPAFAPYWLQRNVGAFATSELTWTSADDP